MAKEPNRLKTFAKPITSTGWCMLLTIVSILLLIFIPRDEGYYEVVLACTTGVSASAVVTFFAERANRNKQKHYISVRLTDFHTVIDRCCPMNVSDERRKKVVEDERFWTAVYSETEKKNPYYRSRRDGQTESDKRDEENREMRILSMVILTQELDELRIAFEGVDMSCLTEQELKWVSGARGCFRKLIACVVDDNPVRERDQMIHMDTRQHAMQKYLSIRQKENERDLIHALIEKNLQDILLNYPNLLSVGAAVKVMEFGCAIMTYVGLLDDEFIRNGYIMSERKPEARYGAYEYYSMYSMDDIETAV